MSVEPGLQQPLHFKHREHNWLWMQKKSQHERNCRLLPLVEWCSPAKLLLCMHKTTPVTMGNKDWINLLIKWVLPEFIADSLLKDLVPKTNYILVTKLMSVCT